MSFEQGKGAAGVRRLRLGILLCGLLALPPFASVEGAELQAPSQSGPQALAGNRLLIARPQLEGLFFAHSVVLLLSHGPDGAVGLLLNRPTPLPLADLRPALAPLLKQRGDRVFVGGPVSPHTVTFLARSTEALPGARKVVGDVQFSGSARTLRLLLEANANPKRLRVYAGYAGWGPGQLEAELARGDWLLAPADPESLFAPEASQLWRKLIARHGGLQVHREPPASDSPQTRG